jgi:feruloyl esterase
MPGMTRAPIPAGALILLFILATQSPSAQGPANALAACDKLATTKLAGGTVTSAHFVAAGTLPPPPARGGGPAPSGAANPFADVPALCRVAATMTPSADSNIKIEVWLPAASWNGKLRGTGNGGLGGGTAPAPNALAAGVRRGYATVGSNTGHEGNSSYALDHPEQIKDFGYRSAHEMTVAAKALIRAFYGSGPKLSLMAEAGGGTIAALSAAQRYPADYDGLAVVAMSSYLTRHTFGQMWVWQATHASDASFLTPDKYAVLNQAALNACDASDGLKDGIIGDPEGCRIDPVTVQCKGAPAANCLTPPQVEAARKIYMGPRHSRTGAELYSPLYPGSEPGWGQLAGGAEPLGIPVEFFKYYVLRDPQWDYKTRPINYDSDVASSDRPEIQPVNAVGPDLRKYFARGGKLLLIGGWADAAVPPKVAVNYYNQVVAAVGEQPVRDSMRFFMVPGMGHGPGTTGPHNFSFDALTLIEDWREKGKAPDRLIVSHFTDGKEVGKRLVCQYPQIAHYKGTGDPETPTSYECRQK